MTTNLTPEQQAKIETMKQDLIDKVLTTQETYEAYPTLPDGHPDFGAELQPVAPLSREEVTILVDEYDRLRRIGKGHAEAAALSYGCCYRNITGHFNPRGRLEEIRNHK